MTVFSLLGVNLLSSVNQIVKNSKMAAGNFAPSLARLTFVECALSSQLASNQDGVLFLSGHEVVVFCADRSQFVTRSAPCGAFQDKAIFSHLRVIFCEAAMEQAMCFLKLEKFQEAEAGCGNCRSHNTLVFTFVNKCLLNNKLMEGEGLCSSGGRCIQQQSRVATLLNCLGWFLEWFLSWIFWRKLGPL